MQFTWEGVLGLVLSVIEYDVVTSRVYESVVLKKVDVLLDLTVHTEDEPIKYICNYSLLGRDCYSV